MWIFIKNKNKLIAISTATVSPKCKMGGTTSGTTKQAPKPSHIITELNVHVKYVFPAQLANSGMKIFILFVLFCFKNRAQVKLH